MAPDDKGVEGISPEKQCASSALEKETTIVQAQQPISAQDQKDVEIVAQREEEKPELPFSKARAIALVLTVTAASFLNVRAQY